MYQQIIGADVGRYEVKLYSNGDFVRFPARVGEWRMFHQIRKLIVEDAETFSGEVEMDETYIGGKHHGKRGRGAAGKTIVAGVVERKGKVIAQVVPDVKAKALMPIMKEYVLPGSIVYTDEMSS